MEEMRCDSTNEMNHGLEKKKGEGKVMRELERVNKSHLVYLAVRCAQYIYLPTYLHTSHDIAHSTHTHPLSSAQQRCNQTPPRSPHSHSVALSLSLSLSLLQTPQNLTRVVM